jgi:ATP-dependent RNA helicase DeaD
VVGTPGRVTDHIRKGTLDLSEMKAFVLDEADEMLKMGFIEDVNWVLEQAPDERQIALFSATMPAEIQRIAKTYLHNPADVKIKVKTATAESIRQRYQVISGRHKIDALTRVLDFEDIDAVLVFVRTKNATVIVAEQLDARGYEAMALNGDVQQSQREQIVQRLKDRKIDIIVATDVAARGLDVPRISHVVNFDAPTDPESYVHRIGRTGRAGKKGDAILFLTPREKRLLNLLSRSTKADITPMQMPSTDEVNAQRIDRFKDTITKTIADEELTFFNRLMDSYLTEHPEVDASQVAAALALMVQGDKPLLVEKRDVPRQEDFKGSPKAKPRHSDRPDRRGGRRDDTRPSQTTEKGMITYRIEVGHNDQVRPSAIVAAVCKASGLQGKHIGRINIFAGFATIDLPDGMPQDIYQDLMHAKIGPKPMKISKFS